MKNHANEAYIMKYHYNLFGYIPIIYCIFEKKYKIYFLNKSKEKKIKNKYTQTKLSMVAQLMLSIPLGQRSRSGVIGRSQKIILKIILLEFSQNCKKHNLQIILKMHVRVHFVNNRKLMLFADLRVFNIFSPELVWLKNIPFRMGIWFSRYPRFWSLGVRSQKRYWNFN